VAHSASGALQLVVLESSSGLSGKAYNLSIEHMATAAVPELRDLTLKVLLERYSIHLILQIGY
jgi:hypothetical protein